MKSEIIQHFKGKINDVEFNDERMFHTMEFLLENIENKFGNLSKDFIKDLKANLENASEKYDGFSFNVLENSIMNSLNSSDKFEDLSINYDGSEWKLDEINKNIKSGKYSSKEVKENQEKKEKDNGKKEKKRETRSRIRSNENER